MNNLEYWSKCSRPPTEALKQIKGGRLKGMTDISPQWRYKIMTDMFGPVGIGWRYEVCERWTQVAGNESAVFVAVKLYYKHNGEWSEAVSGSGGSKLVASESSGLHFSDEAYKMAETDALSVAMKQIGVGADIYMGMWDGSKYKDTNDQPPASQKITGQQVIILNKLVTETSTDIAKFLSAMGAATIADMTEPQYKRAVELLNMKKEKANAAN